MEKVIIITGASSGIGAATAASLAGRGHTVYDFSRHDGHTPGVHHIGVDVTDEAAVRAAVAQVLSGHGHIDILIPCAGFGISGAVEFTDGTASHRQLEVNLFGADNVVRAVLPHMRAQGSGRVLFVSSVAGIIPIPFQAWYSAGKSALLSYALALRSEVRPFHVSVACVLPGDIASGFTAARQKDVTGDAIYGGRITAAVATMEHDEQHGMSSARAGELIAGQALKAKSRPLIALGFAYKAAAVAVKLLPRRFSTWLVGRLYGGN